jgi:hypothetical protein
MVKLQQQTKNVLTKKNKKAKKQKQQNQETQQINRQQLQRQA